MNSLSQNCYILDTGFFVIARECYPDTFPSFWVKMGTAVNDGVILSVHEVRNEIENYGGEQQHILDWIKKNQDIFGRPNTEEQQKVTEIMERFPLALSKKQQLKGEYWADPFVVARAFAQKAIVVSREKSTKSKKQKEANKKAQNPHKIPDICEEFGVRCITPQEFMKEQEWKF